MTATSPRYLLKKIIKIIVCIIAACTGCHSKTNNKGLTILTYHGISDEINPDETVAPVEFEKQMQYVKGNYKVISLEEAVEYIQTDIEKVAGSIVITFDDGYSDNYHDAKRWRNKQGFKAIILLVSNFIEDKVGK